jgi:hypothetical protein
MKDERGEDRVWDSDTDLGGWCHRACWDTEHAEAGSTEAAIRDIFVRTPGGRGRQTLAARRVDREGSLRVRRNPTDPM